MLFISCNIQHFTQQQSQLKLQLSMLQKRTFCHFRLANTANQARDLQDDIIKQMQARMPWKLEWSELLEHCEGCDPKRSWLQRNEMNCTSEAMKR